jgi:uncharacterized Zn finger protein (UPF0148 family)
MSILQCKICGFRTFETNAQKREGRLLCPQCSTFYDDTEDKTQPPPSPKFKFKLHQPEQSAETA